MVPEQGFRLGLVHELVYGIGMFEQLGEAIEGLDIALDGDALAALLALRDRLDARISSAVAAHDRAGLWELDGATSMTAWLVDRAAMPRPCAAATTSRARKLAHLPITAGAWRDGVLSTGQVEAIASNLDAETLDLFAEHEAALVPALVDLPVRDVATAMRAWSDCATAHRDPKPEPPHHLHLSRTLAGRWRLDANLGAETGELLATALRIAQAPDTDDEPARSAATRRADALGDVRRFFLDHQRTRRAGRHRPHINLVLDIERFRALSGAGATTATAPASIAPRSSGCCATPPCTGCSPGAAQPSSTTAPPPAPFPPRCSMPSSSATSVAGSRAVIDRRPGARVITSAPGCSADRRSCRTSCCCAPDTTTCSTSRGGTPSSCPMPPSRSPTRSAACAAPPHMTAAGHPHRGGVQPVKVVPRSRSVASVTIR
jgi:Domain of unknown function (DUF222)